MKMKISISLICIIFLYIYSYCDTTGIGIVIGKPSGINFGNLFKNQGLNITISWKSSKDGYLSLDLDKTYLTKRYYEKKGYEPEPYYLYYGFGGGFKFDDGSDFYLRIPLGAKKDFSRFDVFIQLTPKLKITDETKGDLDLFIGTRYYFN